MERLLILNLRSNPCTIKKDESLAVGVIETQFNATKTQEWIHLNLTWNDIVLLKISNANGYHGEKDEEVVNKWFNDLCKNIMLEDMDQDVVDELKSNISETKKDRGCEKLNIANIFKNRKRVITDRSGTHSI